MRWIIACMALLACLSGGVPMQAWARPQVFPARNLLLALSLIDVIRLDLDGDGVDEMGVLAHDMEDDVLLIVDFDRDGNLRVRARLRLPFKGAGGGAIGVVEGRFTDVPDRLLHDRGTQLALLSGPELTVASLHPRWVSPDAVGDLDGDGDLDLLQQADSTNPAIAVDLTSGDELWSFGSGGAPVLVQLDADASLEVVFLSTGAVVDGASGALQWTYAYDFVGWARVANVDEDVLDEIVDLRSDGVVALGGVVEPLWFMPFGNAHMARVLDADGDGRAELWHDAWQKVEVWAMPSGVLLRSVPTPHYMADSLLPGQFDLDPSLELVWTARPPHAPEYRFTVVDAQSGLPQAAVPAMHDWRFGRLRLVDLNADGRRDILGLPVQQSYWPSSKDAAVGVWDHLTGQPQRALLGSEIASELNFVEGTDVAQLDADAAQEIVLAGHYEGAATVVAYDGATMAPEWVEGDASADMRSVAAGELDGRASIVVLLEDYASGTHFLRALNGGTGMRRWTTPPIDPAYSVLRADLDGDGAAELLTTGDPGVSRWTALGEREWSVPSFAWVLEPDPGRSEVLAIAGCCDLQAIGAMDQSVRTFPLAAGEDTYDEELLGLIPIEPGYALIVRQGGRVDIVDTTDGTTASTGIQLGADSYPRAWAMVDGPHPLGQTLLVGTGYGAVELEVMSSEFIFGASQGGFER